MRKKEVNKFRGVRLGGQQEMENSDQVMQISFLGGNKE